MRRQLLNIGLLLVLVSVPSCASDVANRYYADRKFPPKPVNEVQLLDHAPDRPYDVIADFQSRGESPQSLRGKAAGIGADAIIVTTLGDYAYSQDKEWVSKDDPNIIYTRIVGTAIRYR